jgi:hypothetical protein
MKFFVKFALSAALVTLTTTAYAASWAYKNNGVGIAVGSMGGISGFHKLDDKSFAQGTIYGFSKGGFAIGADYALVFPNAIITMPEITPYVGGGAFIFSCNILCSESTGIGLGARIPLGFLAQIPNAPVHVFLEISPATLITPVVSTSLEAALGVRFLF